MELNIYFSSPKVFQDYARSRWSFSIMFSEPQNLFETIDSARKIKIWKNLLIGRKFNPIQADFYIQNYYCMECAV